MEIVIKSNLIFTSVKFHFSLLTEQRAFLPLIYVFVQECSVFVRKVFDEGRLERRTFLPEKWRAWVRVCRVNQHQRLIMAAIVVSRVNSFSFRKYDVF